MLKPSEHVASGPTFLLRPAVISLRTLLNRNLVSASPALCDQAVLIFNVPEASSEDPLDPDLATIVPPSCFSIRGCSAQ